MKKTILKLTAMFFALTLLVGVAYPKPVMANDVTTPNVEYNLPSTFVPFIYCYDASFSLIGNLQKGDTKVPQATRYVYFYINTNKAAVNQKDSTITVDGQEYKITWSVSKPYDVASIYLPNGLKSNSVIKADFDYRTVFGIKARKCATGAMEKELESLIKANPTTYRLYNTDESISITGSMNTFDVNANFVHWQASGSSAQYIKSGDDTIVQNLPNGKYTVKETYAGAGMETDFGRSSSFPFLAGSDIRKDENGLAFYTFEVTDQYLEELAHSNTSTVVFFGFYTIKEAEKYNLSFDSNGGEGTMDSVMQKKAGTSITLPSNTFTKDKYNFIGWNTLENPTFNNPGIAYRDGSNYIFINSNQTLYAQWSKQKSTFHEVIIHDEANQINYSMTELQKVLYETNSLAYTASDLESFAKQYISTNAYEDVAYEKYEIQVKEANKETWKAYETGMELEDNTSVRYILTIQSTKTEPEDPNPPVGPGEIETPTTPTTPTTPVLPIAPLTPTVPQTPITPIVPVTPEVTPPTETVTPEETPKSNGENETVKQDETPKAKNADGNGGSWALVNLIATCVTVLLGIYALLAKRHKEDEEEASEDDSTVAYQRRGWLKPVALVIAVLSVIIFIVTEDMTLPMEYIDQYTIWMIVIAIVQAMVILVARKWKESEAEEVQTSNQ